jgi:formylglycine-generating enzyme required for sulfatase activity
MATKRQGAMDIGRLRLVQALRAASALSMIAVPAVAASLPAAAVSRCAPDAVVAGTVCLDKYEASVWRVPNATTTNASLVRKIQRGRATEVDLTASGAVQLGTTSDDYAPCTHDGQNCADDIYAVSLPGVLPAAFVTWFQAQEACANSGKRLPTNAEWQVAANGTPDPGPDDHATTCTSNNPAGATPTGSRSACVSARGAFDMVGNVAEWVADWIPRSTTCSGWGAFSDDDMCVAGANDSPPGPGVEAGPGALLRGGFFFLENASGPLSVIGTVSPIRSQSFFGFRCAR